MRALTPPRTIYDLAPMFSAAKQGQGRTLAISNFDGFRPTNVPLYYTQYGLPAPTGEVANNIAVVKISGGGWSTNTASFNVLPSWHQGTNLPTTNNHRLVPDVALYAGGSGAHNCYLNRSLSSAYVGTSFASPVFAGSLGVVEQQIISQAGLPANRAGNRRFGRIQDLIYAQDGRTDVWHDITSGNVGTLPNGAGESGNSNQASATPTAVDATPPHRSDRSDRDERPQHAADHASMDGVHRCRQPELVRGPLRQHARRHVDRDRHRHPDEERKDALVLPGRDRSGGQPLGEFGQGLGSF